MHDEVDGATPYRGRTHGQQEPVTYDMARNLNPAGMDNMVVMKERQAGSLSRACGGGVYLYS